jgi:hypothetical protein
MTKIIIDMNNKQFQLDLFNLEKLEQRALLNTLRKISKLSWEELYKDKGIRWELISSTILEEVKVYSFRFSQKYRGTAFRKENYLMLLALFSDHDGAYTKN